MNKFWKEFKNFAMKGKVIDLAMGVIIGNTFSKVVSSIVSDLIMPVLSMFINFDDYKNFRIPIGGNGGSIAIGSFINNLINLVLVTVILFLFVKMVNKLRNGQAISLKSEHPKSEDVALLEEIRDLLKDNMKR
ncbi:large conductance mechanosensitive channel protein MscL [Romboutsia hominis]|uniref:Large-conductance mechanosensitive channel n=1 Tax=Romboutsia faecis TaxID=2764597 RepID=A0ABR7JK48_9FIRM|nr:large conductance mechanosensitive channel protein MscL [Romboutsia faecis]MBC5995295.1 large conductance mechanosensitive channel protein MscL [Romboutsia faecis]